MRMSTPHYLGQIKNQASPFGFVWHPRTRDYLKLTLVTPFSKDRAAWAHSSCTNTRDGSLYLLHELSQGVISLAHRYTFSQFQRMAIKIEWWHASRMGTYNAYSGEGLETPTPYVISSGAATMALSQNDWHTKDLACGRSTFAKKPWLGLLLVHPIKASA